jgi:transposase
MVTAADTGDRTAAQVLLEQVADAHHRLALVWADGGYTGSLVEHCLATLALVLAIVKRSDDMKGFVVRPKRWIVERFFAHLMRTRRLARDFERRTTSAEAMVYWSMTLLMTRRLARPRSARGCTGPAPARPASPARPGVSPSTAVPPPAPAPRPCRTLRPSPGRSAALDGAGPLRAGGVADVRSQHRIDPPASDHPLLPFQLGHGQLGLDAIGLLTQPVDSTTRSEFVLFQQPNHRRHPRPPGERQPDRPPLPPNHRAHARPAQTQRSCPERL